MAPSGFVYVADFLSREEEAALLDVLGAMEFREVVMRGHAARRTTRHFGYDYGYESRAVQPTEPWPASLVWVRDRAADLAGVASEELAEVLVTRYPPGAGIGWHRDAPMFGPAVVGISLGAACRLRFQRRRSGERETDEVTLAPRSTYVLAGASRSAWQHMIPPTKEERYSVTFRTLTPVGQGTPAGTAMSEEP